ncbi:MAG: hypothetical protein WAO58_03560 [Fimbriimonadaceae bacterium]
MTLDEKGGVLYDFANLERKHYLEHFPYMLERKSEAEIEQEIRELQNYLAKTRDDGGLAHPLIHRTPTRDWHGLGTDALVDAVLPYVPKHHTDFGIGQVIPQLKGFIAYMNKGLHASAVIHKTLRKEDILTDSREPWPHGVNLAAFIALGSIMAAAEVLDFLPAVRAKIAQTLEEQNAFASLLGS